MVSNGVPTRLLLVSCTNVLVSDVDNASAISEVVAVLVSVTPTAASKNKK